MEEKIAQIPNLACGHCVANIKREIGELEGVASVSGDPGNKKIAFRWDPPATWDKIKATLIEIGYPPAE